MRSQLSSNKIIKKLGHSAFTKTDAKDFAETIMLSGKIWQQLVQMSGFLHSRVVLAHKTGDKIQYKTVETEGLDRSKLDNATRTIFDVDYFAFNCMRALCNASLTTGANFRDEPHLNLSIQGKGNHALHALRQELKLHPLDNPYATLLTSGNSAIDFDKPFFYRLDGNGEPQEDSLPFAIYTKTGAAKRIGDEIFDFNDDKDKKRYLKDTSFVLGFDEEDLHPITILKTLYSKCQHGAQHKRILLEAGPTTADPILNVIDFLLLTVIEIPSNDYDGTIPTITCNKNILNDEQLRLAGLELVNENVHFESPYKVRFQSYMHSQYHKRFSDREKGYWETFVE